MKVRNSSTTRSRCAGKSPHMERTTGKSKAEVVYL